MRSTFPILFALILLFSCKNDSPQTAFCGVSDPIEELPWLRDKIEEAKKNKEDQMLTITAVKLGDETVFNYYISYMSCIGCISFYCDGTAVDFTKFAGDAHKQYVENLSGMNGERTVLWPRK